MTERFRRWRSTHVLTIMLISLAFILTGCGDEAGDDPFVPPTYSPGDGDMTDGDGSDPPADGEDGDGPPLPDGDMADADLPDGDPVNGDWPDGDTPDGDFVDGDVPDGDTADGDDPDGDTVDGDLEPPGSCGFTYESDFVYDPWAARISPFVREGREAPYRHPGDPRVAHPEPAPDGYWLFSYKSARRGPIVMPEYNDTLPLFERADEWLEDRCYELPAGAARLSEDRAFELYRRILRETLWAEIDTEGGKRTVLGLRGAYPGTFAWHGNLPNRFNDTLVLLWVEDGQRRVREFPVNTDTGPVNFGVDSSSSLRPNRRYAYDNGWHRGYNALQINEWNYLVRNDTNHNGHWDSDRNGWFPPHSGEDYDRVGSAHNIHMAGAWLGLGNAPVNDWSAGCQTIPGMDNWIAFITQAWTSEGDAVDYWLLDVRDVAPSAWRACPQADGSAACPFEIRSFPFIHDGDTSVSQERVLDYYNCSSANETGPELVYVLNIRRKGTLTASVSVSDESRFDPDLHILEGYDQDACRTRSHRNLAHELPPGRYLLVVDTWVDANGSEKAGPYRLEVDFN